MTNFNVPLKYIFLISILFILVLYSCSNKSNSIFEAETSACNGCSKCVEVCQFKAITIVKGKAVIDVAKCTKCGKCAIACPNDAIR